MDNKNISKSKLYSKEDDVIIESLDTSYHKHSHLNESHRKSLGNELYTENVLVEEDENEYKETTDTEGNDKESIPQERKLSISSNKSTHESVHLNYARILYLISNMLFVFSAITMKLYMSHNQEGGKMSFSFLRYLMVTAYFFFFIFNKGNFDWMRTDFLDKNDMNKEDSYLSKILKLCNFNNFNNSTKFWLIVRSISIAIMTPCVILSYKFIKFSIGNAIFMINPIMSNFIASVLTTEKFLKKYLYSCIISLIGIILICIGNNTHHKDSPDLSNNVQEQETSVMLLNTLIGSLIVLFNSFLVSISNTVFKILTNIDDLTVNLVSGFYAALMILIYEIVTIFFLDFNSYYDLTLIGLGLLNGLAIGLSFHLMAEAFKYSTINQVSYILYSQLPASIIVGYVFFNEQLSFLELFGIAIIIVNTAYVSFFLK